MVVDGDDLRDLDRHGHEATSAKLLPVRVTSASASETTSAKRADGSGPADATGVDPAAVRSLQWALYAVPIVGFLAAGWAHRWVSEDGFIYLRVVRQIRAGNGPVFNAGERAEAFTGHALGRAPGDRRSRDPDPPRMDRGVDRSRVRCGRDSASRCRPHAGSSRSHELDRSGRTTRRHVLRSLRSHRLRRDPPGVDLRDEWTRRRPHVRMARSLLVDPRRLDAHSGPAHDGAAGGRPRPRLAGTTGARAHQRRIPGPRTRGAVVAAIVGGPRAASSRQ